MIQVGSKNVIDIIFNGRTIERAYKGDQLIYSKEHDITVPPRGVTRLLFDQTQTDVSLIVTGEIGKDGDPKTNVVAWIRANSHKYVGEYNDDVGMVLTQLNDNDTSKYPDGSEVPWQIGTSQLDTFMKMPDFWYRCVLLSTNKYYVDFTARDPKSNEWLKWDGNSLIGVYKASYTFGTQKRKYLYSRSGKAVHTSGNYSWKFWDEWAQKEPLLQGDLYSSLTYEAHQVMALLGASYHGTTSARNIYNLNYFKTYLYSQTDNKTTGMSDVYTESYSEGVYTYYPYFWGLSGWFSYPSESIGNLYRTQSGMYVKNVKDGSIRNINVGSYSTPYPYTITKLCFGTFPDVIPTGISYTSPDTKSFYDSLGQYNEYSGAPESHFVRYLPLGSYNTQGGYEQEFSNGGLFSLLFTPEVFNDQTSRLMYHGRVVISDTNTTSLLSVELDQSIMTVSKLRSITPTFRVVIKGKNLDKPETLITDLPEGITLISLTEGSEEREATLLIPNIENVSSISFKIAGYKRTVIINSEKSNEEFTTL